MGHLAVAQTGLRLMLRQHMCCSLFLCCTFTKQRLLEQHPAHAEFTPGAGPQHYRWKILTDQALKSAVCNSSRAKQTQ